MTIKWVDGFELITNQTQFTERYSDTNLNPSFDTGRYAGRSITYFGGAFFAWAPFSADTSVLSVGFAYKLDRLTSTGTILTFRDASNNDMCDLRVIASGALQATRNGSALGSSATGVLVANAWCYVEVEFTRHASAGVFTVYVNGTAVISLTAQNTGANDIHSLRIDGISAVQWFDDLYTTNVATRVGECRVDVLAPTADTAQKDFTPSTGTSNYAMVDDTLYNDDTDYVSASTAGNKDLYDVADLSFTPANVYAVQVTWRARKDDATARTVRANLKSGGTTTNGTTQAMGASYVSFHDLYLTDPNTSAAWTPTNVNAIQIGPEVVS
jgi:hypothetical protein